MSPPLKRWGHVVYLCPLSWSAQSVHVIHFCPSVLRVTVLPKGCMCSLVNQVCRPTSFSLAPLRCLLPVTALPKDGISTLLWYKQILSFRCLQQYGLLVTSLPKDGNMHTFEISRYFHFAVCSGALGLNGYWPAPAALAQLLTDIWSISAVIAASSKQNQTSCYQQALGVEPVVVWRLTSIGPALGQRLVFSGSVDKPHCVPHIAWF